MFTRRKLLGKQLAGRNPSRLASTNVGTRAHFSQGGEKCGLAWSWCGTKFALHKSRSGQITELLAGTKAIFADVRLLQGGTASVPSD